MSNVVLVNVTRAVAMVLDHLLTLYWWIVIISVLLTWVNPDPYNPIVRFLRGVTEPVFHQVRRRLPFVVISGIDLSPIVVLLGIQVVQMVLVDSLRQLAYQLATLPAGLGIG